MLPASAKKMRRQSTKFQIRHRKPHRKLRKWAKLPRGLPGMADDIQASTAQFKIENDEVLRN